MIRLLLPLLALTLLVAGCGAKDETAAAGAGKTEPFTVMLDYFPNADHAGIYAAKASGEYERAGLDVKIVAPPDAALPLKLLEAGRADLAISYEPEVLLARDQGADIVSVGALVQKPLTSLMSLGDHAISDPKQLAGKRVGTSGIPYQSAYLRPILDKAGVDPGSVKETNVGFKLTQAMLSKKVDATLGAFWNYEGVDLQRRKKDPSILRMEDLGVPTYSELVLVVRRRDLDQDFGGLVRKFVQATGQGHEALREDAAPGIDALLDAAPELDRGLQEAAVKATLPVFFPEDDARSWGYQDPADWQAYIDWMEDEELLTRPQTAERVLTNEFLPGEGLDPRSALEQD
jgi:putative hydroxymethylpyrimidine transport system substrate-binding protein